MDMDAERLLKNLLKENRTGTPEEAVARNVANMVEALENEGFEREESIAIAISLITAVIKGQTNGSI
jgi:hypothetical protein